MQNIVLASASPYKKAQLRQLQLPFITTPADINEQPKANEPADEMASRLAREKAEAVANMHPCAWIIGCDQTVSVNGQLLQKPGNSERAYNQLSACSGQHTYFYSAVCLLQPEQKLCYQATTETTVVFRTLPEEDIRSYIRKEDVLDCAGSFKVESLGISLFDKVISDDPSALIGLPMIALNKLLLEADINCLSE